MNKERLLKLAAHLRNGKLGHEVFDMNHWNEGGLPYACGTHGCAIGEMPILEPEHWCFTRSGDPVLKTKTHLTIAPSAKGWFAISYKEFEYLFVPMDQDGDVILYSKEEQAVRIEDFVAKGGI